MNLYALELNIHVPKILYTKIPKKSIGDKMFDFLKGKILINLNKFNFTPGENVEGTITLKMKKPVHARGVKVGLKAVRKSSTGYATNRSSRWETVFEFEQPLDGEKDYVPSAEPQTYSFKLGIPNNPGQQAPTGTVGNVLKAAQMLTGAQSSTKWTVKARLDISGIDISKKVQINVT